MMTHTIRLRGPWRLRALPENSDSARQAESRMHDRASVPGDWGSLLGNDYCGLAEYRRVFHRPTGLAVGEAVFLVIERVRSRGTVRLNEQLLGSVEATVAEFDVTEHLTEPNELVIEVEHPIEHSGQQLAADTANEEAELPGGIVGEVRLEIRSI